MRATLKLVDATFDAPPNTPTRRVTNVRSYAPAPTPRVSFVLRAVPAKDGWTWRLFARSGSSGQPKLVYESDHVFPSEREAVDSGRGALASTWMATAFAASIPSVARAG